MKIGNYTVSGKAIFGVIISIAGWAVAHQAGIVTCANALGSPQVVQIIGWAVGLGGLLYVSQTNALVTNGDKHG